MKKFSAKAIINAPAKVVWATIIDLNAHPEFDPNCISIEGVVTKDHWLKINHKQGRSKTRKVKITTLKPNEIMVWESKLPFNLLNNTRIFTVIAKDDQTTEFHMVENIDGLLPKVFTNIIPELDSSFSAFAKGLKRFIESRP